MRAIGSIGSNYVYWNESVLIEEVLFGTNELARNFATARDVRLSLRASRENCPL